MPVQTSVGDPAGLPTNKNPFIGLKNKKSGKDQILINPNVSQKQVESALFRTEKDQAALAEKAEQSEIPLAVLEEVYDRGIVKWFEQADPTHSAQQYAFSRVASFIGGGKAWNEDVDLQEALKGKIINRKSSGMYGWKTTADERFTIKDAAGKNHHVWTSQVLGKRGDTVHLDTKEIGTTKGIPQHQFKKVIKEAKTAAGKYGLGYNRPNGSRTQVVSFHHSFKLWKQNAKSMGYEIHTGVHPEGTGSSYSRAKDKDGNTKGFFDHKTHNHELNEFYSSTKHARRIFDQWQNAKTPVNAHREITRAFNAGRQTSGFPLTTNEKESLPGFRDVSSANPSLDQLKRGLKLVFAHGKNQVQSEMVTAVEPNGAMTELPDFAPRERLHRVLKIMKQMGKSRIERKRQVMSYKNTFRYAPVDESNRMKKEPCLDCDGKGYTTILKTSHHEKKTCEYCGGLGWINPDSSLDKWHRAKVHDEKKKSRMESTTLKPEQLRVGDRLHTNVGGLSGTLQKVFKHPTLDYAVHIKAANGKNYQTALDNVVKESWTPEDRKRLLALRASVKKGEKTVHNMTADEKDLVKRSIKLARKNLGSFPPRFEKIIKKHKLEEAVGGISGRTVFHAHREVRRHRNALIALHNMGGALDNQGNLTAQAKYHAKKIRKHMGGGKNVVVNDKLVDEALNEYFTVRDKKGVVNYVGNNYNTAKAIRKRIGDAKIHRHGKVDESMDTFKQFTEAKMDLGTHYHSVFYKSDLTGGKWKHHSDTDTRADALEDKASLTRHKEKVAILRVPREHAHWHRKTADEIHDYVETRLKQKGNVEGYKDYAKYLK